MTGDHTVDNQSTLRLVKPSTEEPDSYLFDRRRDERRRASGKVTAVSAINDDPDTNKRIRSLELFNTSDTGVGAMSHEPIEMGSRIVMFFPPHGNEKGFDLVGQVVRCESKHNQYEIGIKLKAMAKPISAA
ncbi:PilZ domain-containing protein [Poriferisphaera sp. WC338]|uniref:PilZ domain-containing protein n=1 Tax=Poriferisphaera sp. WC338 TaxID=3425129 RepID=UPI003D81A408